jgi:GT2 family glycosyltransferase
MMQDVAAIVVTFRSRDLIDQCLNSLISEGVAQANIWVVDNASDDHTADYVQQNYPHVHVISNDENVGFAAANNQALKQVNTDQVLLLNPDAWLAPKALVNMQEAMAQDERIGMVGPRVERDGIMEDSLSMRPHFFSTCLFILSGLRNMATGGFAGKPAAGYPWQDITDGDHIRGSCMLVRNQAILDVGLLDEDFFLYFEETEWCLRFRDKGWRIIIAPQALAYHLGKASVKTQDTLPSLELMRSAVIFFSKKYTYPQALILRVMLCCMASLKYLLLLPFPSSSPQREWLKHVACLALNPFKLAMVYPKARRPSGWDKH